MIRVAVPAELGRAPGASGEGRMWDRVLAELRERVRLVRVPAGRTAPRRTDAWLVSGHRPLPAVGALPVVAQLHEAPWRDPAALELLDGRFAARLAAWGDAAAARATRLVTSSEWSRREIAATHDVAAERIDPVLHGVDTGVFHPGARGSVPDEPYVLFVGALHPRKNLASLRAAMGRLEDPPLLLVVGPPAGDRPLDPAEFAALTGGPGVLHRQDVPDAGLAALMAGAAAFCLPSLGEGFGLPVLEALACGAPVVCSNRGALPEVAGDAALVVEPDPAAIAAALKRVLGDRALARRLGEAGPRRAAELSWRRTGDGWLACLERAVSGVGAPA